MVTERQIQETVARCVSTMVYYHNCERSHPSNERMTVEVQVIAGFVEEWKLKPTEVNRRVIRPLEVNLIARFGHELGPRLLLEFLRAFETIRSFRS